MEIFEFAMEKERFSEDYYRRLSSKTANPGLSNICKMLADEESKHRETVDRMSRELPADVAQSPLLVDAKKIFQDMKESVERFNMDVGELELYRKAREIEEDSRRFYLEQAERTDRIEHRRIFEKLAGEEQKHFIVLDNICDFVATPETYLENAEFYHFDDYVEGTF